MQVKLAYDWSTQILYLLHFFICITNSLFFSFIFLQLHNISKNFYDISFYKFYFKNNISNKEDHIRYL